MPGPRPGYVCPPPPPTRSPPTRSPAAPGARAVRRAPRTPSVCGRSPVPSRPRRARCKIYGVCWYCRVWRYYMGLLPKCPATAPGQAPWTATPPWCWPGTQLIQLPGSNGSNPAGSRDTGAPYTRDVQMCAAAERARGRAVSSSQRRRPPPGFPQHRETRCSRLPSAAAGTRRNALAAAAQLMPCVMPTARPPASASAA